MFLLTSALQALVRCSDPFLVPAVNRWLVARTRGAPSSFRRRVEHAIDRAIAYFEAQMEFEFDPLFLLHRVYTAGLEPRLAFVEERIAVHRRRWNDPGLRLFDRAYDPSSPRVAELPEVQRPHPILALMIKCIYADRLGLDEAILDELAALDDNGGYGTTHIVVGGNLLKEYGTIDKDPIDRLLEDTVPKLVRAQRTRYVGDQFAERIYALQLLGRHRDINPAWLVRLVKAQLAGGDWRALGALPEQSNQHTSCLALAVLIQYRAHGAGPDG